MKLSMNNKEGVAGKVITVFVFFVFFTISYFLLTSYFLYQEKKFAREYIKNRFDIFVVHPVSKEEDRVIIRISNSTECQRYKFLEKKSIRDARFHSFFVFIVEEIFGRVMKMDREYFIDEKGNLYSVKKECIYSEELIIEKPKRDR